MRLLTFLSALAATILLTGCFVPAPSTTQSLTVRFTPATKEQQKSGDYLNQAEIQEALGLVDGVCQRAGMTRQQARGRMVLKEYRWEAPEVLGEEFECRVELNQSKGKLRVILWTSTFNHRVFKESYNEMRKILLERFGKERMKFHWHVLILDGF